MSVSLTPSESGPQLAGSLPDALRLTEILYAVRRFRVVAALVMIVCLSVSVAYALLAEPRYRATAVLMPSSPERNLGGASLAGGQLGSLAAVIGGVSEDPGTEEALSVLSSRRFTEDFIREHVIADAIYVTTGIGSVNDGDDQSLWRAYKYFDKRVRSVSQDRRTGLVKVTIQWSDPQTAANWANALVEKINSEMRTRDLDNAAANARYLEKELLSDRSVQAQESIGRLIELQLKRQMMASVSKDYAFKVIDPAMAPAPDDKSWPVKRLIVALGLVFGVLLGLAGAVVLNYVWRK